MGPFVRRDRKGFTVIELLVVVLILGILATVAIMAMLSFKEKGGVATLRSDLKSAYKTSLQYYVDVPSGTVTLDILQSYGYRRSKNIALDVVDGNDGSLNITAVHSGVAGVYQVDQDGHVSKQ
jgi:prepilin-type N-terminal cleavage/methylation domain-containing protein